MPPRRTRIERHGASAMLVARLKYSMGTLACAWDTPVMTEAMSLTPKVTCDVTFWMVSGGLEPKDPLANVTTFGTLGVR